MCICYMKIIGRFVCEYYYQNVTFLTKKKTFTSIQQVMVKCADWRAYVPETTCIFYVSDERD